MATSVVGFLATKTHTYTHKKKKKKDRKRRIRVAGYATMFLCDGPLFIEYITNI